MNATASSQTGCSGLAPAPELCPYGAPAAATSPPAFVNKPSPFSNSYLISVLLNLTNTTLPPCDEDEIPPDSSMEPAARIALTLVIILAAATLMAYAFQRSLIYYPSHARLESLLPLADREDLLAWRDAEQRFIGWRTRTGQGAPVLILHGNAGHALHRSDVVARLRDVGVGSPIYILEYPGYGARPGTPTEENLVAAATDAIDLLGREVVLLGESLGSGVACQAAWRRPKLVTGLVLVTPYDSLATVARKHYPFIPAGFLLRDRYQSARALQNFHGPLAVIVAEKDTIIPAESARKLFESYHGPKKLWLVPRAEHNEVLWRMDGAELLSAFEFAEGR